MSYPLSPEQQQAAAQFVQQQHQHQSQQQPPAPQATKQLTVADIISLIQSASDHTANTIQQSSQSDSSSSLLPAHLRSLHRPRPYDNREVSGKFKVWERDIKIFCRVQGLDPNAPGRNQMCRTLVEMNCVGEALAHVERLSAHTPPTHPFWTYEGLLHALDAHFSHPEEAEAARRALDSLKMTSKTSARAYCTQFERLLDAVDHMSSSNILYTFTCGLTPRLKEWVNFSKPSSLQDAIALVVRMGGDEQLEQAKQETTATPMDLNKLVASTVTRSLKRLNVGQQQTRPEPSDPRKDKRWPS
jgi:hypothetical protein